jgi:23S rRNA (guanine745-N1)-methyltransferase
MLGEIPHAEAAGIDISKWAIKSAAKCHKNVAWAVASSKRLPIAEKSQNLILCLFGFPFWESFRSALAEGSHILLVDPSPQHLLELRDIIYDQVRSTDLIGIEGATAVGFRLVREETLTFRITLETNSAIHDLLSMTPHGYRITSVARERLAQLTALTTRVSVTFRLLELGRDI